VVDSGSGRGTDLDASMQELVRTEGARLLGAQAAQGYRVLHSTDTSAVVMLKSADPERDVVFKVARLQDSAAGLGADFQRTAAVVGLARDAGVPAPAVLAVDTSGRSGPWQYLLQEHVSGTTWRQVRPLLEEKEVDAAHREIAEVLLAIQTVRFDQFGELDRSARPAGVPLLRALRRRADRILRPHDRHAFRQLLDLHEQLFVDGPQQATLVHDDLHHDNILFAQRGGRWRLAGVIDWDKAWSGPPESDVARMAFWDDMTGHRFWQVYDEAVAVTAGRDQRLLLYQLLWCLEYGDGSDRHAGHTAELWRRSADVGRCRPSRNRGC